jgi:hypothetical protein
MRVGHSALRKVAKLAALMAVERAASTVFEQVVSTAAK